MLSKRMIATVKMRYLSCFYCFNSTIIINYTFNNILFVKQEDWEDSGDNGDNESEVGFIYLQ